MRSIIRRSAAWSRRAPGPAVFTASVLVLAAYSEKIIPMLTTTRATAGTGGGSTP